jgi:hypothetical protein
MHGAAKIRPPLFLTLATRPGRRSDPPSNLEVPMLLERLTAWTLVVVYYTITCGAILLGLRGAL